MNLAEKKARWAQMLVQATGFAAVDNTVDALARARLCAREVREALEAVKGGTERSELTGELRRAEQEVARHEKLHADWIERTRERGDTYQAHELERYEGPLPGKP